MPIGEEPVASPSTASGLRRTTAAIRSAAARATSSGPPRITTSTRSPRRRYRWPDAVGRDPVREQRRADRRHRDAGGDDLQPVADPQAAQERRAVGLAVHLLRDQLE